MNVGDLVNAVYNNDLVRAVLGLILANVLVGIAVSLYTRTFRLGDVGDWLLTRAIPYLLGAGVVQVVLLAVPEQYSGMGQATGALVWGFVLAALVGKILTGLRELGLPVPDPLTASPKPAVKAGP